MPRRIADVFSATKDETQHVNYGAAGHCGDHSGFRAVWRRGFLERQERTEEFEPDGPIDNAMFRLMTEFFTSFVFKQRAYAEPRRDEVSGSGVGRPHHGTDCG